MDFCTPHFGKHLNDLTFNDLILFFAAERTETDQLEFKSINSKPIGEQISGIQKAVCGFLNSSGGLLIWGSPPESKNPISPKDVYTGELTFFEHIVLKDTIVSKISDSIIPLPNTIRARVIDDGSKSMVVIEVDSSEYSPHINLKTGTLCE